MATLVLRNVKGSPLTNTEVDGNFSNILADVGVITNLSTGDKSNVVSAVNQVSSNVGVTSNLTTTTKANLVAAVNEVYDSVTPTSIVYAIALG